MNLRICCLTSLVGAALFFAGCSPEEMEVEIPTSAIVKAIGGECGVASVTASFDIETSSAKEKLPKIRAAALPYLGEGGKITMRSGRIIATFNVPILPDNSRGAIMTGNSIAVLKFRDDALYLVSTPQLQDLNYDLSNIDFSMDVDLNAKHAIFKIVGDVEDAHCKIKATAVFIDGEAKITYVKDVGFGEDVDIEFRCDSGASVYSQLPPFIEIIREHPEALAQEQIGG